MMKVDSNLWMDFTEIENNEYRQFTKWVRDSVTRQVLVEGGFEEYGKFVLVDGRKVFKPDFDILIDLGPGGNLKIKHCLKDHYDFNNDSFYRTIKTKAKKVAYSYYKARTLKQINIYPDTICMEREITLPIISSLAKGYFSQLHYDAHPVVGVTYDQMLAFCNWRTQLYNNYNLDPKNENASGLRVKYTLPTHEQWKMIAQLGSDNGQYAGLSGTPTEPITRKERKFYTKNGHLINIKKSEKTNNSVSTWKGPVYVLNTFGMRPVKPLQKLNNRMAIFGLGGNVAEVCIDKTIVGGSWFHSAEFTKTDKTIDHNPDIASAWMGFRCVVSIIKE
jgi:sulfatase modifying factor 1